MWTLTDDDLEDIAAGTTLLGTGGGGDPHVGTMLVRRALAEFGPVRVLDVDDLEDTDLVIPTSMMGAPTVMLEKLPNGAEARTALARLEQHIGRTATATMPTECGGINAMIPLMVGAQRGIPVVDGDGMGRCFPELQMETFAIGGVSGTPLALATEFGETVLIETNGDNDRMEQLARALTVELGGTALIANYAMSGAEVKRTAVRGTLALAGELGRALRLGHDDLARFLDLAAAAVARAGYTGVVDVFDGTVVDVERVIRGGFTRGSARLRGVRGELVLQFQNEYHTAMLDGQAVVHVPDLICTLEADTLTAVNAERLTYGQRIRVLAIGAPAILTTPAALDVVGPRAFGVDADFVPLLVAAGALVAR